ncbi:hypothetical protein BGX38DRAFT_1267270 [Terfezia claveryi]|nr:hypothetical protein BGX38DRAFT_1267270 [Terfezia claveryi]
MGVGIARKMPQRRGEGRDLCPKEAKNKMQSVPQQGISLNPGARRHGQTGVSSLAYHRPVKNTTRPPPAPPHQSEGGRERAEGDQHKPDAPIARVSGTPPLYL